MRGAATPRPLDPQTRGEGREAAGRYQGAGETVGSWKITPHGSYPQRGGNLRLGKVRLPPEGWYPPAGGNFSRPETVWWQIYYHNLSQLNKYTFCFC